MSYWIFIEKRHHPVSNVPRYFYSQTNNNSHDNNSKSVWWIDKCTNIDNLSIDNRIVSNCISISNVEQQKFYWMTASNQVHIHLDELIQHPMELVFGQHQVLMLEWVLVTLELITLTVGVVVELIKSVNRLWLIKDKLIRSPSILELRVLLEHDQFLLLYLKLKWQTKSISYFILYFVSK